MLDMLWPGLTRFPRKSVQCKFNFQSDKTRACSFLILVPDNKLLAAKRLNKPRRISRQYYTRQWNLPTIPSCNKGREREKKRKAPSITERLLVWNTLDAERLARNTLRLWNTKYEQQKKGGSGNMLRSCLWHLSAITQYYKLFFFFERMSDVCLNQHARQFLANTQHFFNERPKCLLAHHWSYSPWQSQNYCSYI